VSRNFKFDQNLRIIKGTFHEDLFTFTIISRRILPRMRDISDKKKSCRKIQTHILCSIHFFQIIVSIMR